MGKKLGLLLAAICFLFLEPSVAQTTPTSITGCLTNPPSQGKAACIDAFIANISNSTTNPNSASNVLITLYQNIAGITTPPPTGGAAGGGTRILPRVVSPQPASPQATTPAPTISPGATRQPAPAKPGGGITFY